ncbi:MAG: hypothetical protein AB1758_16595 [Candidatus Eremiobacterota bacterium]
MLLALLTGIALAQPLPRLTLLKPDKVVEVSPGGSATVEMMGVNLELFRYGQVMEERRRLREFTVELSEPSNDGSRRSVTLRASAATRPGVYELRLFTPTEHLVVPLEVQVR